ncbi:hypothetical protein ABK905_11270 [Acerihabitans sp. KWT182]|uniref:Uncharacterized protein n=1 Tax=Acerihabitans sp. KWT182 TaxID=3157919 RepID=A0AAU7QE73_9GAMM
MVASLGGVPDKPDMPGINVELQCSLLRRRRVNFRGAEFCSVRSDAHFDGNARADSGASPASTIIENREKSGIQNSINDYNHFSFNDLTGYLMKKNRYAVVFGSHFAAGRDNERGECR